MAITQHKTKMQQQIGQVGSPEVNSSGLFSLCSAFVLLNEEKCDIGGLGGGLEKVIRDGQEGGRGSQAQT